MKSLISTTFAALMIASSSMAFAADNKGNNNNNNDMDKTGSVTSKDTPTQFDIDRCKTAPADDATCDDIRTRGEQ